VHPSVLLGFSLLLGPRPPSPSRPSAPCRRPAAAISAERAPWLRQLLGPYVLWLVLAVATGVGIAVSLGMLRLMFGWRLKVLVLIIVPPTLALTVWAAQQPDLAPIIGLAWDCGAITTGPVTVPLVLAVGIGVAASTGRSDNPLSGFGIVTLASLFPIVAVLSVATYLTGQGAEAMLPLAPASMTAGMRRARSRDHRRLPRHRALAAAAGAGAGVAAATGASASPISSSTASSWPSRHGPVQPGADHRAGEPGSAGRV
jgi:hypothetical protein